MEQTGKILVAGSGAGGGMLAAELARLGVPCVVFEELGREEYLPPPRSNMTNVRSMTLLRRLGLADEVRSRDTLPTTWPDRVLFLTSLKGRSLYAFEQPFGTGGVGEAAPEAALWAPEMANTTTIRKHLLSQPLVDLRFGRRVAGFEQDAGGVTVEVTDVRTGATERVHGLYLVGADGGRSTIRRSLGVKLEGKSDLRPVMSVLIRAPRLTELADRMERATFYWFVNPDAPAFSVPHDEEGLWAFHVSPFPVDEDPRSQRMRDMISAAAGEPIEAEILGGGPWDVNSVLAPTFHVGRVFLVGDAAHIISPLGGFGLNISYLDAVDLAWKLAATVQGWAGPGLLESYTTERRYADRYVMDFQEQNAVVLTAELVRPELDEDGPAGDEARARIADAIYEEKLQEFESLFCQLGYRYDDSPAVVDDGSQPPPQDTRVYVPSAYPGCLAPHLWLNGDSLYDRLGRGFTLLRLDDRLDVADFEQAAADVRVPLDVLTIDSPRARELYEAPLALIRPDQHVAWRGSAVPDDPQAVIDVVRGA
jgi:2-polyprenyl-6-methoxyphenol hydroxylase-like FAD-dependent oxidoreductase